MLRTSGYGRGGPTRGGRAQGRLVTSVWGVTGARKVTGAAAWCRWRNHSRYISCKEPVDAAARVVPVLGFELSRSFSLLCLFFKSSKNRFFSRFIVSRLVLFLLSSLSCLLLVVLVVASLWHSFTFADKHHPFDNTRPT